MRARYLINLFKIIFSLAVSHVQQYFTIAVISSFGTDKNAINHNVYFVPRLSGLIGSKSFNFNFQFSPDAKMFRLLPHILCLLLINLFSRLSDFVPGTFSLLLLMANCKWKKALYVSVNVCSKKVLIGDTILFRLLLETGPPFYMVIKATQSSSRLQCKGSTFISQLF